MFSWLAERWNDATRRRNSLYLVGDGDDDDLIDAIDKRFNVDIRSAGTLPLITMGQLYDEIVRQIENRDRSLPGDLQLWTDLCDLVLKETGQPGPLDRDTTFSAHDAK